MGDGESSGALGLGKASLAIELPKRHASSLVLLRLAEDFAANAGRGQPLPIGTATIDAESRYGCRSA